VEIDFKLFMEFDLLTDFLKELSLMKNSKFFHRFIKCNKNSPVAKMTASVQLNSWAVLFTAYDIVSYDGKNFSVF
jgi:hypothetical protein